MTTFDFNTLKDNTFCIYDVKEGQADKIKWIMKELGIERFDKEESIYYFANSSGKNRYNEGRKENWNSYRIKTKETYRRTATLFLEEYAEWKTGSEEPIHYYTRFLGKKYAVHCKTQEEWDRVTKALDYTWHNNAFVNYKNIAITTKENCYCRVDFYKQEGCTILSVAEFFGEEEAPKRNIDIPDFKEISIDWKIDIEPKYEHFYGKSINERREECQKEFDKLIKPNKINKLMNTIKRVLRSKEDKALAYFELGTSNELNMEGKMEFLDFIYETGSVNKKEFLQKIVKAYDEVTKK